MTNVRKHKHKHINSQMNKYTILSTNTHDNSSIHSIALAIVCIIFAMVLSYFTNMPMTTACDDDGDD